MNYRILILIDHAMHSVNNSVYNLARSLLKHPKVSLVDIASRSSSFNHDFFHACATPFLTTLTINKYFTYDPLGEQFNRSGVIKHLQDFDLIILRIPHPVSHSFFAFLTSDFPARQIINRPEGIEITGGKEFLLQLHELCPPMLWCRNLNDIILFHREFDLVLKPLRNYGGKGILKVEKNRIINQEGYEWDLDQGEDVLGDLQDQGYLAMKYLKNVHMGDKRIVVVNGRIAGASLRMPAPGSWICNVSQGGSAEASQADKQEQLMAIRIQETVAPLGIGIFGMDTLVDDEGKRVLSEINTLSVGGVGPMEIQHKLPVSEFVADELLKYYEQTFNDFS